MSVQFQRYLVFGLIIASVAAYFGYGYGRRGFEIELKKLPPTINVVNKTPSSTTLDMALFWRVLELINEKSIYRPLDTKKVLYGAIKGLTESLNDPYTVFLSPSQNESVNASLEGKYEGIGAELGMKCLGSANGSGTTDETGKGCAQQQLIIVAPLDASPAKEIGIRAGDWILKIDGQETTGISLNEAVSKIRGKAGTSVTLNLSRSLDKNPFDVTIRRAKITVKSVKWEEKGSGIAYIRISRFGKETNEEWDQAVAEVLAKVSPLKTLVLDVRNNPGGYLESAIYLASDFIKSGPVVFEEFADSSRRPFNVDHQGKLTKIPVIVLINKGSASASEILAGALRDVRGAKLVGEKSFGKGSVQEVQNFPDGSGVHYTIAKWLTPKGELINGKGLEADVKIEVKDEEVNGDDKDLQLEGALETARGLTR